MFIHEGRYRDGIHAVSADGLMRRMVKEDLKTFDGKPLFPERSAYTVSYELSDQEKDLYEAVTQYVRDEMNRAEQELQHAYRGQDCAGEIPGRPSRGYHPAKPCLSDSSET